MAKDDERPQFNPKHRIAGAIILVSLAVIFVPMLLDESTPPAENQTLTQIPPREAGVAETKVVVTPVEVAPIATSANKSPPAATDSPGPTTDVPPATPAPTTVETAKLPAPKPAAEKHAETTAKAKPVAAKPADVAEKVSKGWLVQVGTFANADNASRLRERLKELGFAVNAENITVQGSKAVRLRVGPYRDKAAATRAQAQLQKELNIQGLVLAYP